VIAWSFVFNIVKTVVNIFVFFIQKRRKNEIIFVLFMLLHSFFWYDGNRQKGKISKGKMSKTKMRCEDEHVRLRARARKSCTSIHSHFQHVYLSTFVLFSISTFFILIFFLSAFFHPFNLKT